MTKVSAIVPCHNNEKTIIFTLESLLAQTLKDIEIICVNDHSSDNTLKILMLYEKQFPKKIKVVDLKEKKGCSAARNFGLKFANGEVISFIDGDDMISRNMYLDFYYDIKYFDADIAIGNLLHVPYCFNKSEYSSKERPKVFSFKKNKHQLYYQCPSCCTKIFRRELLEEEEFLEGRYYEDLAFTYPILLKSERVLTYSRYDYFYRSNPFGIMNSSLKPNIKILDLIEAVAKLKSRCIELIKYEEYKNYIDDIIKEHLLYGLSYIEQWDIDNVEKTIIKDLYEQLCEMTIPNHLNFNSDLVEIKVREALNIANPNIILKQEYEETKGALKKIITENN